MPIEPTYSMVDKRTAIATIIADIRRRILSQETTEAASKAAVLIIQHPNWRSYRSSAKTQTIGTFCDWEATPQGWDFWCMIDDARFR